MTFLHDIKKERLIFYSQTRLFGTSEMPTCMLSARVVCLIRPLLFWSICVFVSKFT